jgi:hypothetical protein
MAVNFLVGRHTVATFGEEEQQTGKEEKQTLPAVSSPSPPPAVIDTTYEVVKPATAQATRIQPETADHWSGELDAWEGVDQYRLRREKQQLELMRVRDERVQTELDAEHGLYDLSCIQGVNANESGCRAQPRPRRWNPFQRRKS